MELPTRKPDGELRIGFNAVADYWREGDEVMWAVKLKNGKNIIYVDNIYNWDKLDEKQKENRRMEIRYAIYQVLTDECVIKKANVLGKP
jgi:hypothetical protein